MDVTRGKGLDPYCMIPWTAVSERLKNRRSLTQCMFKWQVLQKRLKNNGVVPMWGPLQSYYLFQQYVSLLSDSKRLADKFDRLKNLDIQDESEINWRDIVANGSWWNFWSFRETAKRFKIMKQRIPGLLSLSYRGDRPTYRIIFHKKLILSRHSYQEIMEILDETYGAPPPDSVSTRGKQIVVARK